MRDRSSLGRRFHHDGSPQPFSRCLRLAAIVEVWSTASTSASSGCEGTVVAAKNCAVATCRGRIRRRLNRRIQGCRKWAGSSLGRAPNKIFVRPQRRWTMTALVATGRMYAKEERGSRSNGACRGCFMSACGMCFTMRHTCMSLKH